MSSRRYTTWERMGLRGRGSWFSREGGGVHSHSALCEWKGISITLYTPFGRCHLTTCAHVIMKCM